MRPWMLSLIATVLVVGGAFALYPRDRERPPNGTRPTVPGALPLTEADVRTFIEVQPLMLGVFQGASEDTVEMVKSGSTMEEAQALLAPLIKEAQLRILVKYHRDLKWYGLAQLRISSAVKVVRFEDPQDPQRKALEREIHQEESLYKHAVGEERKRRHADNLDRLKRTLNDWKYRAPQSDQQLVKGFWQELNGLVPRTIGGRDATPPGDPEERRGR